MPDSGVQAQVRRARAEAARRAQQLLAGEMDKARMRVLASGSKQEGLSKALPGHGAGVGTAAFAESLLARHDEVTADDSFEGAGDSGTSYDARRQAQARAQKDREAVLIRALGRWARAKAGSVSASALAPADAVREIGQGFKAASGDYRHGRIDARGYCDECERLLGRDGAKAVLPLAAAAVPIAERRLALTKELAAWLAMAGVGAGARARDQSS